MILLLKFRRHNPFGILTCMNLFCSDFVCPISAFIPTHLKAPRSCSHYTGDCLVCTRTITWTKGIFCMNFCHSLGKFNPCRGAWCGNCYSSSNKIEFFHQTDPRWDSNDPSILRKWKQKEKKKADFDFARDGDHLLTPFQCDLCVFRRINNRDPLNGLDADEKVLAYV